LFNFLFTHLKTNLTSRTFKFFIFFSFTKISKRISEVIICPVPIQLPNNTYLIRNPSRESSKHNFTFETPYLFIFFNPQLRYFFQKKMNLMLCKRTTLGRTAGKSLEFGRKKTDGNDRKWTGLPSVFRMPRASPSWVSRR
jgi:hypothetical protein